MVTFFYYNYYTIFCYTLTKPSTDEPDPVYVCIAVGDCSICCERDELTNMFKTQCGHYFHRSCIQRWCDKNDSCPICREANPFNRTQKKIDFGIQSQTQNNTTSNNYDINRHLNYILFTGNLILFNRLVNETSNNNINN